MGGPGTGGESYPHFTMASAAAAALKTVIVPPAAGGMPSATVFLLHGLGDTAQGWLDVARMLGRDQALQHIRFVLPTAPVRPITLNMGMKMTGWFDGTYIYNVHDSFFAPEPGS